MRVRTLFTVLALILTLCLNSNSKIRLQTHNLQDAISIHTKNTQTVISPDDPYWYGNCILPGAPQSPININPPFTYMEFDVVWNFQPYYRGILENEQGFNLKMEGDFGHFEYKNKTFSIHQLKFKSPSEHTFGPDNMHMPLEMQIEAISHDSLRINIAVMFSKSEEDGEFLSQFGFGNKPFGSLIMLGDGILQHLSENQKYQVKQPIDLEKVVARTSSWLMYTGSQTSPPCSPTVWFISYDTYKISERQIADFPKQLLYKNRKISTEKHEIYASFKSAKSNTKATTTAENEAYDKKKIKPVLKNPGIDSFTIVGDDTPYTDPIYPSLLASPNPRPIKSEDYIIVNNPDDPTPYLEYLKISKEKVNNILDEIEDKKISENLSATGKNKEKSEGATQSGKSSDKAESDESPTSKETKKTDIPHQKDLLAKGFFEDETHTHKVKNESPEVEKELLSNAGSAPATKELFPTPTKRDPSAFFTDFKNKKNQIFKNFAPFVSFLEVAPPTQKKISMDLVIDDLAPPGKNPAKTKKALTKYSQKLSDKDDNLVLKIKSHYENPKKMKNLMGSSIVEDDGISVLTQIGLSDGITHPKFSENSIETTHTNLREQNSQEPLPKKSNLRGSSTMNSNEINRQILVKNEATQEPLPVDIIDKVDPRQEGQANEDTKITFGPTVPTEVKKEFLTEGRGEKAYDRNGNWDGYNIYDTLLWPDYCK